MNYLNVQNPRNIRSGQQFEHFNISRTCSMSNCNTCNYKLLVVLRIVCLIVVSTIISQRIIKKEYKEICILQVTYLFSNSFYDICKMLVVLQIAFLIIASNII